MWAHSERETLSCPTHTHRPTQTDAYGATWTHTDLHTHTSSPPSVSQGGGSFASHMVPRPSWAVQSLVVGWGWGICCRGGSVSLHVIPTQQGHVPHPSEVLPLSGAWNLYRSRWLRAPLLLCSHSHLQEAVGSKGQSRHWRYTVHAGTLALPLASNITSE